MILLVLSVVVMFENRKCPEEWLKIGGTIKWPGSDEI